MASSSQSNGGIRLQAVGDIALNDAYDALLEKHGPNHPFERILPVTSSADIVIGNLEGPLTRRDGLYPGKCSLRSHPDYASGLKHAGISVLSFANNHILDSGPAGLEDTGRELDRVGIGHVGMVDGSGTQTPAIVEANGMTVGLLAYCDVAIDSPFYYPEASPGIAKFEVEAAVHGVSDLVKRVDAVVVSLHWGIENLSYPSPSRIEAAHALVDAGATLVLGHHPHVVQGIERYGGGCIAYSLGNWVFSDIDWEAITEGGKRVPATVRLRRSNRRSIILDCVLDGDGIRSVDAIACRISNDLQVIRDPSALRARTLKRISAPLSRPDYAGRWDRILRKHGIRESAREQLAPGRLARIHKLRPRHIQDLYNTLVSALGGGGRAAR